MYIHVLFITLYVFSTNKKNVHVQNPITNHVHVASMFYSKIANCFILQSILSIKRLIMEKVIYCATCVYFRQFTFSTCYTV